jgi:thioesterase domain-containing protein/NADP-dependent 3-hydroxy acid dehydrogenase YdfG/acyl carrier protein
VRFYRPGWQRADLPAPSTQRPITGELLLLLTDRGDLADALAEALEGQEILVQGGEEALPHGVRPATIVDLRGLERPGDDGLQGFYRTLATLQAVVGMQRRAGATPVRLLVATAAREAAMVPALLRVANQEHPALRAQAVEISPREMAEGPGRIVAALLGELTAGLSAPGAAFQPQVVYRAGERWVPQWETLALPPPPLPPLPPETSLPLREGGVYLLTGGLGRIGLTLAEGIARRCRGAKLALLGRSSPAPGDAVHRRLQAWREAGADVEHWRADVSSREQLAATLQEIHRRWGPVDGVIHAAGVPSREAQRPIEVLERNDCEPHFAVKVAGTRHLVELLTAQQPPPAFGVFCSSLASRLGGLGFGAYAAANAFLDSLAVQLTRQHPETRWLSVLWDGWNPVDASGDQAPAVDVLLSSRQGEEAFATLLASPVSPRVAVALGDLQHRYQAWVLTSHGTAGAFPEAAKDAPLTERILGVWRRLFGETGLKATDDFFELGGNSLLAVRLAALLEAELGLRLPVAELLRRPSVAALAAYFEPGTGRRWNPIVSIQPEAALPLDTPAVEAASQPPLICVHGAGGALLNFSPLAAALGPHHPLLGLQASGLEEGHNLFDSLESMARFYLPYLKEIGQEGPFHLLGYCFGGLVAYEIARQLTGSGATVGFLGLLDTPLPRVIAEESRLLEQDEVQRLTRLFGGRLPVQEETLRSLPADERLGHIVQQAQKASLLPPEMSDESALRYLQLFQNHLDLQIRYTPEPLKAPITFFSARQGGLLRPGRSTVEGWRTLALGDWVHHELPGDHWSMLDPPHLESLVEHLRATRVE